MPKYIPYIKSLEFSAGLLSKVFKEIMRKAHKENGFNITYEEFIILETLYLFPGIIQGDIVKKIFIQRNYVCKLLAKLEDNGYIRREKSIRGKRQILLNNFITDKGEAEYQKIKNWISKEYTKRSNKEFNDCLKIADILYKTAYKAAEEYKIKF